MDIELTQTPHIIVTNDEHVYKYREGCCGGLREKTVVSGQQIKNHKVWGCCIKTEEHLVISGKLIETSQSQYAGASYGCLLTAWLLFGCFGWHRCVAGKVKSGVLQGITFGGLLIWWIIDLWLLKRWMKEATITFNAHSHIHINKHEESKFRQDIESQMLAQK